MAKKGGTGKPFKPGISGNPNGRPPLPTEIKTARAINKLEVEAMLNKFLDWPVEKLVTFVQDKASPVLEVLIARILVEAIKKGDHMRLNFLLDRLIGKVKEHIEHSGTLSFHAQLTNFINGFEPNDKERITHGQQEKSSKKS